jgi:hypothetical protein
VKRNGMIILAAAVVVGAAALSAGKLGGRSAGGGGGKCSGGACCPVLPGLNVWSTNSWGHVEATNAKAAVTAEGAVKNRAQ